MKLALSILCENAAHKTGLTTMFHELVASALAQYPDVTWVIFAGPSQPWLVDDPRVEIVRDFQANDKLVRRLFADLWLVPEAARRRDATALLTVGLLPLRRKLPVIPHLLVLSHLSPTEPFSLRRLYRSWMARRCLRKAPLVITNSDYAAGRLQGVVSIDRARLLISPEGINHAQFKPEAESGEAARLEEKFGLKPGYLIWISNFYPYKQAEFAVAAYARLTKAERLAMPLVMAGGDWQGGVGRMQARAAELGVAEDVRYFGWVDDAWLAPLYRQARAFCVSSREETFGRSVLEAMACGTPCVVNDIPVVREVTAEHALILDFTDAEIVAAAFRRLLTEETLRATLRAGGLKQAKVFSFARMTRERVEAISACCGPAGARAPAPTTHAGVAPRLLQVFNVYLERGGEEDFVERVSCLLGSERLTDCTFRSADWLGQKAPSRLRQVLCFLYNPRSVRQLMAKHQASEAQAWVLHNVFPVGSAGIFREAWRRKIPIIHFIHNFRPISIAGTYWIGNDFSDRPLRPQYWKEVWHGTWQNSRLRTAWMGIVLAILRRSGWLESVKAWIAVSEFMRRKFIEAGIPAERVHTLLPFFLASEAVPTLPEEPYYFFVSRLIPEKGIAVLTQAWDILRARLGDAAPQLYIAGRGPAEGLVRAAAERNPAIKHLGFISTEEKARLIGQCRAMLAPSTWWEPLGYVTFEAYNCAKPMLAADIGGLAETVSHGVTGLLHEAGNAAQLAEHVLLLEADAGRRAAMGAAGRAWLLAHTNPDVWKRSFDAIVEKALAA